MPSKDEDAEYRLLQKFKAGGAGFAEIQKMDKEGTWDPENKEMQDRVLKAANDAGGDFADWGAFSRSLNSGFRAIDALSSEAVTEATKQENSRREAKREEYKGGAKAKNAIASYKDGKLVLTSQAEANIRKQGGKKAEEMLSVANAFLRTSDECTEEQLKRGGTEFLAADRGAALRGLDALSKDDRTWYAQNMPTNEIGREAAASLSMEKRFDSRVNARKRKGEGKNTSRIGAMADQLGWDVDKDQLKRLAGLSDDERGSETLKQYMKDKGLSQEQIDQKMGTDEYKHIMEKIVGGKSVDLARGIAGIAGDRDIQKAQEKKQDDSARETDPIYRVVSKGFSDVVNMIKATTEAVHGISVNPNPENNDNG